MIKILTVCGVLSVMVLAGGVVMFNNYQKMKAMESVIASVVPEGTGDSRNWSAALSKGAEERDDADKSDFWKQGDDGELEIEEVPGEVYPTLAEIVIEPESEAAVASGAVEDTRDETGTAKSEAETSEAAEPVQAPADAVSYIVKSGETVYGICMDRYNSMANMENICLWNGLGDGSRISAGQEILVPPVEVTEEQAFVE